MKKLIFAFMFLYTTNAFSGDKYDCVCKSTSGDKKCRINRSDEAYGEAGNVASQAGQNCPGTCAKVGDYTEQFIFGNTIYSTKMYLHYRTREKKYRVIDKQNYPEESSIIPVCP